MKSFKQREPLKKKTYRKEEIIVDDFGQQWVFEDQQFKIIKGVTVELPSK